MHYLNPLTCKLNPRILALRCTDIRTGVLVTEVGPQV